MSRLSPTLAPTSASLAFSAAHAQTCTDPHYRWTVKTTWRPAACTDRMNDLERVVRSSLKLS